VAAVLGHDSVHHDRRHRVALDGYYARKLKQISDFGRIADPAVDKITVCGTLVFLAAAPWAREVLDPWMVAVILSREFVINGLRSFLESKGISFAPTGAARRR
jgi:CDP-diacylglycerol--glycerol-3-phosphate 3-phosphatidyltransferase